MKKYILISSAFIVLFFHACRQNKTVPMELSNSQTEMQDTLKTTHNPSNEDTDSMEPSEVTDSSNVSVRKITAEMAYEGVNNYCHHTYDWSIAEDNPSIMSVAMGEETESEYEVIFRSYTGAFVHFYVDKTTGATRMVERVPSLDVENEAGTINILDYLKEVK